LGELGSGEKVDGFSKFPDDGEGYEWELDLLGSHRRILNLNDRKYLR
jgi:hypothetical protein